MKTREERHHDYICAALSGLCANTTSGIPSSAIAMSAVSFADAVLVHLDGTGPTAPKPETPSPDADGWIEHRPGDAMPCDGGMMVLVKLRNGSTWDVPDRADWWADDSEMSDCWRSENSSAAIIAWKPA